MLYEERYPTEPVLNISEIRELFPIEFRQSLRMDLNRPFGNGVDDDNDGMVDEPSELATNQTERYPTSGADKTLNGTYYSANLPPRASNASEEISPARIGISLLGRPCRDECLQEVFIVWLSYWLIPIIPLPDCRVLMRTINVCERAHWRNGR